MLELKGLSVAVDGKAVVDGVSLTVWPGQVTALLGANGAGNSELVLAVVGLLPLAKGTVMVKGTAITADAALTEVFSIFPEPAERKKELAGTLSGGQQQMVAIGHALVARPRFILIDEMSLGLAP